MKSIGKVGIARSISTRPKEQRISTLEDNYYLECKKNLSHYSKMQRDESITYSKAGLSTQDTYTTEQQRTQTDELMAVVGLGCLVKNSQPKHKRTSTEISNLAQFENVDEDLEEEKPLTFNVSHIKKSPLPKVVDLWNEFGGILKMRK